MMMMKTDPFTFYLQVKGMVGKRVVGKRGTSHVDDDDDDDRISINMNNAQLSPGLRS